MLEISLILKLKMTRTIDMACMRYLNLFEKITGVRTKNCFSYNKMMIFAVPHFLVSKAIGENGSNARKISPIFGKKIKIIGLPRNYNEIKRFISEIVEPVRFQDLEVSPEEIIITANRDGRASLIGRDRVRFEELNRIVEEFFNKKLRII